MADEKIDAFLYFGAKTAGKGPRQINGETSDVLEGKAEGDYGKSMAIKGYDLGFTAHAEGTEETNKTGDSDSNSFDPTVEAVTVRKPVDAATPHLLSAVWYRTVYEEAWLVQKKAGGKKGRSGDYFWEIMLSSVVISNITWSADDSGGLTETLKLEFQGIDVYYKRQKVTGELEDNAIHTSHYLETVKKTKDDDNLSDSQIKEKFKQFATLNKLKPLP